MRGPTLSGRSLVPPLGDARRWPATLSAAPNWRIADIRGRRTRKPVFASRYRGVRIDPTPLRAAPLAAIARAVAVGALWPPRGGARWRPAKLSAAPTWQISETRRLNARKTSIASRYRDIPISPILVRAAPIAAIAHARAVGG